MRFELYKSLSRRFYWKFSIFEEKEAWLIYDRKYNQEYYVIGNSDALRFMVNRMAQSKPGRPNYEKMMNEKGKRKRFKQK